ncbi:iron-sulfur cluster biosynthesis family protein [Bacillus cereus]|uniref:HesB/IscA family protein n=1 Tax=Bacillus cereus TaxID=1396 RepID=UPI002406AF58|nr:iron-sulfur cluster biosynthesis family protein [Bacillus cereus]MDF9478250.1 iron-sulfur cluster biosynthesis family protein [Bacillus cereus]MDF9499865.1 iron-sulfur cluster biosynthesis family protein [Bacillus cereus]MDF9517503.1 iron-sulfur cluster biosynthesis family protein [Bacillus cereus]MDF9568954.1 iron-sulfur cluster biosynthesis family protein [Bacillus cereus]
MNITDKAKEFIENAMKENGVSTLRFTFEGAGCCGPSYGINLEEAKENDVKETVNGIAVAMDPKVAEIANALTLDYVEDQQGAGLVISGGSNCC